MTTRHDLQADLRTRLWLAVFALAPAASCVKPAVEPYDVVGASCVARGVARKYGEKMPTIDECPGYVTDAAIAKKAPYGWTLSVATTQEQRKTNDVCCYEHIIAVPGRAYGDLAPSTSDRWLRDAALEHASIASFARATLELMAVGAPLWIIREMQAAALDEVEHAALCLELAGAVAFAPLPALAPRALDIAGIARTCFEEACANETIAAAAARDEAERASGREREVLLRIADDEERHAALAWRTLRWAVAAGGIDGVRDARSDDDVVQSLLDAIRGEWREALRAQG